MPLGVQFPVDPTPVLFIASGVFLTIAVVKYGLFVLPASEELSQTKSSYALEPKFLYLILDEEVARAYEIFTDQVTHARQGMCLSKIEAEKVKERYGLKKNPSHPVGLGGRGESTVA